MFSNMGDISSYNLFGRIKILEKSQGRYGVMTGSCHYQISERTICILYNSMDAELI